MLVGKKRVGLFTTITVLALSSLLNIIGPLIPSAFAVSNMSLKWANSSQILIQYSYFGPGGEDVAGDGGTLVLSGSRPTFSNSRLMGDSGITDTIDVICTYSVTLTVDASNAGKGTLSDRLASTGEREVKYCSPSAFKGTVTIANTAAATKPLDVSATDITKQDCAAMTDSYFKARCEAIQACTKVTTGGSMLTSDQCSEAWKNCTSGEGDEILEGATPNVLSCASQISTGKLDAKPVVAGEETKESQCNVDSIGWIVCPVMNFIASLNDGLYDFIAGTLVVKPELFTRDSTTYKAWDVFKNYANVMFVIAFLVIIYSQVTSAGISNYGIKRMLPKIIIAAILVNISFFICQLAVDLSNIAGYGIKAIFDQLGGSITITTKADSGGWAELIGQILAGALGIGTVLALLLAVSVPVLLAAFFALALIAFILLARQALIVLLIVIAPLAFVAYLLPNTESLFKKWSKLFFSLLMLFPVVSAVFGASALAAAILSTSSEPFMKIVALGATALPLFVVPGMLKGALAATGKMGAKMQGWGDKATGRVGSAAKNTANRRTTPVQDAWKYRKQQREIRRARKIGEGTLRRGALGVVGGGGYSNKLATQAAALEDKEYEEGVSAAKSSFAGKTFEDINNLALDPSASEHVRTAAVRHVMEKGNFSQRRALVEASSGMSSAQKSAVVNGVMSRGDQAVYGAKVGDAIVRGEVNGSNVENYVAQNIADGKIKAETMVLDADATKLIADVSTGGRTYDIKDSAGVTTTRGISATERASVRTAAADAETLSSTSSKVSENFRAQFRRL